MQETTYDYHIIVGDDCSSDRTLEIVKQYQEKYPDKITLLKSETNQRLYKNVLRAYEITKTDYFCVLDPDDFWTDKYKIQKALDFLEKNKDYTIYVTDTDIQTPEGERKPFIKRKKIIDSDFNDYLHGRAQLGCTLGSTFRNVIFKNGIPEKMKNLETQSQEQSFRGDSFRTAIHLHEGKAHCVPEVDAIYRVTDEGLWQGENELSQKLLTANYNKDMWLYYDKKYPVLLFNSYKAFCQIKTLKGMFKSISDKENKIIQIIKQLTDLEKIYENNISIIKSFQNKAKFKYIIMRKIYKKLYKKLSKKGLIYND